MTSQHPVAATGKIYQFENYLPRDLQTKLEGYLSGPNLPWVFNKNAVFGNNSTDIGTIGFYHTFFADGQVTSEDFKNVSWVLNRLSQTARYEFLIDEVVRVRANLLTGINDKTPHEAHVDYYGDHYVAVYYVNDCDGDLIIYNETFDENIERPTTFTIKSRITPKKGMLVCFNGRHFHSTTYPTTPYRISLVYNFTTK